MRAVSRCRRTRSSSHRNDAVGERHVASMRPRVRCAGVDRVPSVVSAVVLAVVTAGLTGCQPAPAVVAPAPRASAPARAQPKLVVLLVIDQLPVYAFERDRALYR